MRFVSEAALSKADATVNETSAALDLSYCVALSCIVVATGATITGTLKIQVCNDLTTPVNWVDSTQTVSVTGAGVFLIPKFDVSYMWARCVYTATTSVAGATVTAIFKTVGF